MILSNHNGTMADQFSIGKNGPTIRQGSSNPNIENMVGAVGDLYVQLGAMPTLYQFRSSKWIDITGEVFTRTAVTTSTYTAVSGDLYLGVQTGGCTINLPNGTFGKKFIIKDEAGTAGQNPIQITAAQGDTIDGGSAFTINSNRAAVTLVFGTEWHVVSVDTTTTQTADSYRVTVPQSSLDSSGAITIQHNLNEEFPLVQVYNPDRSQAIPDEVVSIDQMSVKVKFNSYSESNFAGNWTIIIRK